jgi:hypothetical protein
MPRLQVFANAVPWQQLLFSPEHMKFHLIHLIAITLSLSDAQQSNEGIWTWIGGTTTVNRAGVYGIKGIPNPSNFPGARGSHTIHYHPSWNSFILFGGTGYDESGRQGMGGGIPEVNERIY